MRVELKKIGTLLMSRQAGKEAFLALRPLMRDMKADEILEIEFDGVTSFSPSWGDEFLTPLQNELDCRLRLRLTANHSVQDTIAFLEQMRGYKFC